MQRGANKSKSKRFVLVKTFFDEVGPKCKEDLDIVFRKVNVLQHLNKIFATSSSRWLQVMLFNQFPVLREWLLVKESVLKDILPLTCNTTTSKTTSDVLYVGLVECLETDTKTLQKQIRALEEAIVYAELRQAHPHQNVLTQYTSDISTKLVEN